MQRYAELSAAKGVPTFTVLFGESKAGAEMEIVATTTVAGSSMPGRPRCPPFQGGARISVIRDSLPPVTDLIIFDCDGVLVDSERIAIRTNIAAFAEYGHTATEEEIIEQFVGKDIDSIQRIVSQWLGAQQVAAWTESVP